jgi:hypothetical protein
MRRVVSTLLTVATLSLWSVAARAEEGGAGHYFPGGLSSFIDLLPANFLDSPPGYTYAISNDSTFYHGSNNHLDANATSYTDT